jgi:hypothetical protein
VDIGADLSAACTWLDASKCIRHNGGDYDPVFARALANPFTAAKHVHFESSQGMASIKSNLAVHEAEVPEQAWKAAAGAYEAEGSMLL